MKSCLLHEASLAAERFVAERWGLATRWRAVRLDEGPDEARIIELRRAPEPGGPPELPRSLMGKIHADDKVGARCWHTMLAVAGAVRDRRPCSLAVPEPAFYEPRLRLLVMQRAAGAGFDSCPQPRNDEKLRLAGRALAQLHALPLDHGLDKRLDDHVSELIRPHPVRLAEHCPEHRSLIHRALEVMERVVAGGLERGVTLRPIHRDFQLRQLFFDDGRVWLLDWDTYARGDPAFDVAYFVVYLRNHLPRQESVRAVEVFLEGYRPPHDHLQRLPVYEAFNYLRRACRRFRLRDPGWQPEMQRMLGSLAESLDRVGA